MTTKRFYGKGLPHIDTDSLRGKLIVLEGSDGSGRTTQIEMLRDWLERTGYATEEVGLNRSMLVSTQLEEAKQGNVLCPTTLALFYATDFADQLENKIIPALRSSFIVLADRYIYTMMARAIVRQLDAHWIKEVYSIALVPDAVFYLEVNPRLLAERIFKKNEMLDYWESGMDIRRSGDLFDNFIAYQRQLQKVFRQMQADYGFEVLNANRPPSIIARELQTKIQTLLDT